MDVVLLCLLITLSGIMNIACFAIGAKVGQSVSKGEDIEVNPVKIIDGIKDRNEQREANRESAQEAERLDVILENIKNYNGTSNGQRDVPRG